MALIKSIRSFIMTFPGLEELARLDVDHLEASAVNYSIDPLPGARKLEEDILGNVTREYSFAVTSRKMAVDNLVRISNNGFFEDFANWLDEQTDAGNLPDLGPGKEAESIEATSWGYLFQRDQDDQTGIYQITCRLTYSEQKG